jgi:hypothetical protein
MAGDIVPATSTPHPPNHSLERLGPSLSPLRAGGIVIAPGVDTFGNASPSASKKHRNSLRQSLLLASLLENKYGKRCQAGDNADEVDKRHRRLAHSCHNRQALLMLAA